MTDISFKTLQQQLKERGDKNVFEIPSDQHILMLERRLIKLECEFENTKSANSKYRVALIQAGIDPDSLLDRDPVLFRKDRGVDKLGSCI